MDRNIYPTSIRFLTLKKIAPSIFLRVRGNTGAIKWSIRFAGSLNFYVLAKTAANKSLVANGIALDYLRVRWKMSAVDLPYFSSIFESYPHEAWDASRSIYLRDDELPYRNGYLKFSGSILEGFLTMQQRLAGEGWGGFYLAWSIFHTHYGYPSEIMVKLYHEREWAPLHNGFQQLRQVTLLFPFSNRDSPVVPGMQKSEDSIKLGSGWFIVTAGREDTFRTRKGPFYIEMSYQDDDFSTQASSGEAP